MTELQKAEQAFRSYVRAFQTILERVKGIPKNKSQLEALRLSELARVKKEKAKEIMGADIYEFAVPLIKLIDKLREEQKKAKAETSKPAESGSAESKPVKSESAETSKPAEVSPPAEKTRHERAAEIWEKAEKEREEAKAAAEKGIQKGGTKEQILTGFAKLLMKAKGLPLPRAKAEAELMASWTKGPLAFNAHKMMTPEMYEYAIRLAKAEEEGEKAKKESTVTKVWRPLKDSEGKAKRIDGKLVYVDTETGYAYLRDDSFGYSDFDWYGIYDKETKKLRRTAKPDDAD